MALYFLASELSLTGVTEPLLFSSFTPSPSITCLFGRRPPQSMSLLTLTSVARLSHAGYTPTASSDKKSQAIPTETQPVKKDFEKMYLDPYMGMGHSTNKDTALLKVSISLGAGGRIVALT